MDPEIDTQEKRDEELVLSARQGDQQAFGDLIERYQVLVKSVALRMVSDPEAAREMVQETFLQAWISLDRLRDEARFKSWLYGIVINVCRGYLRDHETDFILLGDLSDDHVRVDDHHMRTPVEPQVILEKQELHEQVYLAIGQLPEKYRQVVWLFYYQFMSLREISEALNISLEAVKVRLHRARRQLIDILKHAYPEIDLRLSAEQRRNTMSQVRIADVIIREDKYIVFLYDESGGRALPIWIGKYEAHSIAMGLRDISFARPLTYSFIANVLDALGAEMEEARIEALKEDTYYGVARLRQGSKVWEVDSRPSDILALAARTGSPIYVGDEVMEEAGVDVKGRPSASFQAGEGIDALVEEIKAELQKASGKEQPSEERERHSQEIADYISKGH